MEKNIFTGEQLEGATRRAGRPPPGTLGMNDGNTEGLDRFHSNRLGISHTDGWETGHHPRNEVEVGYGAPRVRERSERELITSLVKKGSFTK
jgi:hypothetical protein